MPAPHDVSRTLYLLRHAKSSWAHDLPDRDRPLAPRGRHACARIAAHLREQRISPGLVLCSSAARTRETLERIAAGFGGEVETRVEDGLYAASAEDLLDRLHAVPAAVGSVMLIAHDPGIQELALALARPGPLRDEIEVKFPTGGLATLALATAWDGVAPGTAELVAFVRPRQLG